MTIIALLLSMLAFAQQPAAAADSGYQSMSIADFFLHDDALTARHSKVELTGLYFEPLSEDGTRTRSGTLYASQQDVQFARSGNSDRATALALDMRHASAAFWTALAKCTTPASEAFSSTPAWHICVVTVRGTAEWQPSVRDNQIHTDAFAYIDVLDGDLRQTN